MINNYNNGYGRDTFWYDFIVKSRPRIIFEPASESDYSGNIYNTLRLFEKNTGIEVSCEKEIKIDSIKSMQLETISDPFAIFILDVDSKKAQQISSKYNVICHPFKEDPKGCPLFQEGIETFISKGGKGGSWSKAIPRYANVPSNALIIIDRYLFSPDGEYIPKMKSKEITIQDAIDNVHEILDKALPLTHEGDFHILFVFDNINNSKGNESEFPQLFEELSKKLYKLRKKWKRPYTIHIETLSINWNTLIRNKDNKEEESKDLSKLYSDYKRLYSETHNRRILSNYYLIRVEHSFKAFREGENLYTQTIWLDWAGSKGIFSQRRSDIPATSLYHSIKMIRTIVDTINEYKLKGGEVKYYFCQDDNPKKEITEILNRLILNYEYKS
ncbi:MAG: hypothetical protein K2L17_09570 [Muribaculaceae bacterium]|nr:hypothetical protein [Muribaculaceae bacterium]